LPHTERHTDVSVPSRSIHRRRFLRWGLAAASALLAPRVLKAAVSEPIPAPERRLAFFNTHTGERLEACYCRAGRYDPGSLKDINHILRDHRTGEVGTIATDLLDLLHRLRLRVEPAQPFHIISGYRSVETNAVLHRRSRGVASQSLHLVGKAIDIRVPGIRTGELKMLALELAAGGVGYYPQSDFVHVDIGRVRSW
jgi:uncharacterized protein YcbK (DUF882 family)